MGIGCNSGRWVACCFSEILYSMRPVGQAVKTRPFHGCNMGSIPVRVTKTSCSQGSRMFSFYPSFLGRRTRIAAQATAACGGYREPEQGRGSQKASPAQGAQPDAGHPRPVQGGAGDSPYGSPKINPQLRLGVIFVLPYEELLRRRPPPAADAGSRSRAAGRRRQAPPKGRSPMRGTRARYRAAREIPVRVTEHCPPSLGWGLIFMLPFPLQPVLLGNQPFEFFFQFLFIPAVGGGQP